MQSNAVKYRYGDNPDLNVIAKRAGHAHAFIRLAQDAAEVLRAELGNPPGMFPADAIEKHADEILDRIRKAEEISGNLFSAIGSNPADDEICQYADAEVAAS